jgi:large subunit ribosomal protein L29
MKKKENLREFSTNDLIEKLDNDVMHLTKLNLNHAVNPLDNPNTLGDYRRTIARIKTELRRREIEKN